LVEFTLLRDTEKARGIVNAPDFRKADFQVCKELVSRTPWESVLRVRGAEQTWQIFKDASIERKSSQSPDERNQARKGRDMHG